MAKENREGGIQIGTASLILIFVVLTLSIFAMLSMTSALADDRITDRTEEWVSNYYAADTEAVNRLAEIDKVAEEAIKSNEGFGSYMEKHANCDYDALTNVATFEVEINENVKLEVSAKFFEGYVDGKHFEVERWQEVNAREYNLDESMPVWDGNGFAEMED